MQILLVGKGGREHALAWKLSQSKFLKKLYIWPGHPPMQHYGEALPLPANASFRELGLLARSLGIDAVISGPEAPLSEGLADELREMGLPTFGPIKQGAQLEASKNFAKDMMSRAGIPTALFELAHSEAECRRIAVDMLRQRGGAVLKASGLAAGKGVFVCTDEDSINEGLRRLYHGDMQQAASTVVVEEVLKGRECSYFTFLGKEGATGLGFAVDFKRLRNGDLGPNTGGMGCYAPVPWLPKDAEAQVIAKVVEPLRRELAASGIDYCGWLYVGLMWGDAGPQVIEFNVRLGDPEAQVLAAYDPRDWLGEIAVQLGLLSRAEAGPFAQDMTLPHKAVAVVVASAGYPYGENEKSPVALPESLFEIGSDEAMVFGASIGGQPGAIETGKGRVLTVVGRGATFDAARAQVYRKAEEVKSIWDSCQFRTDIAEKVAREHG